MLTQINLEGFNIYNNQIISNKEFANLYKSEKILTSFQTQINNTSKNASATLLAEKRHMTNISEGNFVIFRAIKENKKFEFISQIGKWGDFYILKEVIDVLGISNHEIIKFEVIKTTEPKNRELENIIDLADLKKEAIILFRENGLITIIQKGKIPVTIPRFIKVTPELIELFFLIHGDGHYQSKLFFVNKDEGLHKFVMEQFEKIFRIPMDIWRARLLFNNSADKQEAKQKWKTSLKLTEEQFYPTISICSLHTSERGNLRIVIDKTIVSLIFRHIFDKIKDLDEVNSLYALNGLLCAEGSVDKAPGGGLHRITISFSQKEKEMFEGILQRSKIYSLVETKRDRFIIDNWSNLYPFFRTFFSYNLIPFNLHEGRCNKALSGFLEHSFTRTMEKYLTILNEKEQMSTPELVKEMDHLGNSIRNTLRKKQYKRFVESHGKYPFVFSITKEGKEFLALIKKIKEAYAVKNVNLNKTKDEKPINELLNLGIINIDKPSGPTSFSVTDYIRKSLGLNKTSHMGTLE